MDMDIKNTISSAVTGAATLVSSLAQAETDRSNVPKTVMPGMPEQVRAAAAEGAVLLKNDGILPLKKGTKVALLSRVAYDYFYVGYGSGGDVYRPYEVSLADGIRGCEDLELNETVAEAYREWREKNPINHGYWAHWPLRYKEMPLSETLVRNAAAESDVAIVTIGRAAGEDRDNELTKNSYYLHPEEKALLKSVTAEFNKVIVLMNIGGVMDFSELQQYSLNALMIVWQGGMESGNAVADLLCGKVSPSGRLADTIAVKYEDYPSSNNFGGKDFNHYTEDIYVGYRYFETFAKDKVLYPFGFGLSYSSFSIKCSAAKAKDNGFAFTVKVKNTGACDAKEAVQLYIEKPCGKLGNPSRELVAFAKTKTLAPGQTQQLTLYVDWYQLTSYDDCGDTGNAYAYVLEQGNYGFYLGNNVRDAESVYHYYQEETTVYEQLKQAAAPPQSFDILCAREEGGKRVEKIKNAYTQKFDLASRILGNLPPSYAQTGDVGIRLSGVKSGKATLEQFVAQLSLEELEAITRGDYEMDSALGAKGNAGAFCGVLPSLRDKGVPPLITTDGPSGIRLQVSCSLLPSGTLLACTFNTQLLEQLCTFLAQEMKEKGSDVLLAPGINIHRNPLCGRNFEYFSEDPYLTGKLAAAYVRGVQSAGASACPKHYACNSQEYKRTQCDSRVSERALRQIYLKGFEICVKEAKPKNLMTSYNKINGVWGHYHYDLCTTVLRGEWGYEGSVMTDWWMRSAKSPEFPCIRDQAYRVRAQVDVLMPGATRVHNNKPDGTLLASYIKKAPQGITLGEMQRSAMNVLRAALRIK